MANTLRLKSGRELSEDELDLLWEKLSRNLWNGYRVKIALIKMGAFLERCSNEEIDTHLRVAELIRSNWNKVA